LIDEMVRKTNRAKISAATKTIVQMRLLDLKPQLEQHFNVTLSGCESPQFLVYKSGYFYGPHRDGSADPDAPEYVRARRVSVVTFLNGDAAALGPHGYSGGSLTLYGLIDDASWKTYGFPLSGQPGLLVAFRADTIHEVTPITAGDRYSIVTWFF
jgi:predicted 2-oxoglutarate/Fe(II)-dependent dioxygenase YbiX